MEAKHKTKTNRDRKTKTCTLETRQTNGKKVKGDKTTTTVAAEKRSGKGSNVEAPTAAAAKTAKTAKTARQREVDKKSPFGVSSGYLGDVESGGRSSSSAKAGRSSRDRPGPAPRTTELAGEAGGQGGGGERRRGSPRTMGDASEGQAFSLAGLGIFGLLCCCACVACTFLLALAIYLVVTARA